MIVVASVPHTGTHFVLDLLKKAGFEPQKKSSDFRDGTFCHMHSMGTRDALEKLALHRERGDTFVSPLRHPMKCAETWAKRRKQILPARKEGRNTTMIEAWHNFIVQFLPLKPILLPVDAPDRENWLVHFCEALGCKVETDWTPVFTSHREPRALDPEERQAVDELIRHPFIAGVYG